MSVMTIQRRRDAVLRRLSESQDRLAAGGTQTTCPQARLARRLGLTRARMEQVELLARLHFLQGLARRHPHCLLELGGTYEQVAFLNSICLSAQNARRVWRRWRLLGQRGGEQS